MILTYKKVLASKKFRQLKVLAGIYGLENTIENIEMNIDILEGNGSNTWLIKELKDAKELDKASIESYIKVGCSGLGIKTDFQSNTLIKDALEMADKLNFPIIEIPSEMSFTYLLSAIENIYLDIKFKRIYSIISKYEINNHDNKILNILSSLSKEVNSEVRIYDILSKKIYSSKGEIQNNINLSYHENIWNPKADYIKKSLSEDIEIFFIEEEDKKERLVLKIDLENNTLGYLVIEDKNIVHNSMILLSVKITYTVLLYEYKMLYSEVSEENREKDRIINDIILGKLNIEDSFFIKEFGKHKMRPYTTVSIRQLRDDLNMFMRRERLEKCIYKHVLKSDIFLGILDCNELVILIAEDRHNRKISVKTLVKNIIEEFEKEMEEAKFLAGFNEEYSGIEKLKDIYAKGLKCLDIGELILKGENVYSYEDIGPFIFFDICGLKENREKLYRKYIGDLLKEDDGRELLETLRTYLNCNLNVSSTAKKMFLHNNTIRYRINKIEELLNINLKDYFSRIKLEVILMFMDILKS